MGKCQCQYHDCSNNSIDSFITRTGIDALRNIGLSFEHQIVKESIKKEICIKEYQEHPH